MNDVLEYCKSVGITLHDEVAAKLEIYARELLEWNKIHNLSGASTLDSLKENIIDSKICSVCNHDIIHSYRILCYHTKST